VGHADLKRKRLPADMPSMFKRKSAGSKGVVGLDLEPSHIAAAEVHVNGSITVKRGAVAPLRPGILRDGEVVNAAALTEALREMWAEHDLPKTVRLGIANQRIVVRALDVPPIEDPKGLAAAVRVEAPDHIPMPMEEAILDFQPIGLVDTPAGKRMRVVVVAVRKEMVERYAEAVQDAGLKLEGIDLSAFAMVRALGPASEEGATMYVNVGGLTNVAVAAGEHCLFTRAASGGLEMLVQTLAERRSLTMEHANQWLTHVGLERPLEEVEGDADLVAAARQVLEEGVHQLADTIRNSLNFYRMQPNSEQVDRAVLTGPAVAIPGFAAGLSTQLRMPVEMATIGLMGDAAGADASRLSVAAGLAVESI
jgi:type IV pilus assembly protein PilM